LITCDEFVELFTQELEVRRLEIQKRKEQRREERRKKQQQTYEEEKKRLLEANSMSQFADPTNTENEASYAQRYALLLQKAKDKMHSARGSECSDVIVALNESDPPVRSAPGNATKQTPISSPRKVISKEASKIQGASKSDRAARKTKSRKNHYKKPLLVAGAKSQRGFSSNFSNKKMIANALK